MFWRVKRSRAAAWFSLLVCLLDATVEAYAQNESSTTVSGSLRLDYFSSSRDLDNTRDVFGAHAEFKLSHQFSADQRFELETRLSRDDLTRDGRDRARFINGYWFTRAHRLDLRVGQQKIRWGKADGINPTDFFTPIDYTVLLPLEADQYLSVPAVRADVQINETNTLSLVVEPDFTPSRLPWPKPTPVSVIEDQPSGLRRPQYGMRLLHTGEILDWSVSAFRGFSTLPVLSFAGIAADGSPQFLRYYPASKGLGVDLARNLGKWGLRAELAYTTYEVAPGRQPVASNYFLVAGFDRSIDHWSVNIQGLWRYTPDYKTTNAAAFAPQQFSATQNAIVYNQQDRLTRGMTVRIGANWLHDTLQTEVRAVAYFDPTNYLLRPLVTYALSDSRKVLLGGEYYSGPDLSFFGSLKRNRTLFAEFQQFF